MSDTRETMLTRTGAERDSGSGEVIYDNIPFVFYIKFSYFNRSRYIKAQYSAKLLLQPPRVHVAMMSRLDRRWRRLVRVFLHLRVRVCVGSRVC